MNLDILYVIIYSYILGSIPFGLIITKFFLGKDIRNIGSGNIGTTNVLRTGKKSLAAATLILDVLKGYTSIFIANIYFNELIYLSASTFHGASKSNIQISPSEPLDNVPLLIFKILAGFIVKASIILFSGRDSL